MTGDLRGALSGPTSARVIEVRGGSGGFAASYAELRTLATHLRTAGDRLREVAATTAHSALDPDLLASAPLAPVTFAQATAQLLEAASGRQGAALQMLCLEGDAVAVSGVTSSYLACDLAASDALGAFVTQPRDLARDLLLATGPWREARDVKVTKVPEPCPGVGVDSAPDGFADLLEQLQRVGRLPDGTIQIQRLPDGGYIVYLPGTDDLDPRRSGGPLVRDDLTNLQLIAGQDDDYTRGVVRALREAGASGHDVVVVGHSQGGLVAQAIAAQHGDEFRIRQVVTAGSPRRPGGIPATVPGLSLENVGDPVPMLDGQRNPDRPNLTTVVGDVGSRTGNRHALQGYRELAAAAENAENPAPGARGSQTGSASSSVSDQLERLRKLGLLGADQTGEVQTYQIRRS